MACAPAITAAFKLATYTHTSAGNRIVSLPEPMHSAFSRPTPEASDAETERHGSYVAGNRSTVH